jgi:hypothetical protein
MIDNMVVFLLACSGVLLADYCYGVEGEVPDPGRSSTAAPTQPGSSVLDSCNIGRFVALQCFDCSLPPARESDWKGALKDPNEGAFQRFWSMELARQAVEELFQYYRSVPA